MISLSHKFSVDRYCGCNCNRKSTLIADSLCLSGVCSLLVACFFFLFHFRVSNDISRDSINNPKQERMNGLWVRLRCNIHDVGRHWPACLNSLHPLRKEKRRIHVSKIKLEHVWFVYGCFGHSVPSLGLLVWPCVSVRMTQNWPNASPETCTRRGGFGTSIRQ